MEDAHHLEYDFGGESGAGYFAIFDGHAGKSAAVYCAAHLHTTLLDIMAERGKEASMSSILAETFDKVDGNLGATEQIFSGCTAIVAFIRFENEGDEGNKRRLMLYTANVGDARAVLSKDGKEMCLSIDHKASDPAEAARIFEQGGVVVNGRVNAVLAVTRALGDHRMKDVISGKPFTAEVEVGEKDDLLILACDGVWDVMSNQEAVDLCLPIEDPQKAAVALVDAAMQKGSQDNISALVVRFHHGKMKEDSAENHDVHEEEHVAEEGETITEMSNELMNVELTAI